MGTTEYLVDKAWKEDWIIEWERGWEIGWAKGWEKGWKKGRKRAKEIIIARLLTHSKFTNREIAELLTESEVFVAEVQAKLNKKAWRDVVNSYYNSLQ